MTTSRGNVVVLRRVSNAVTATRDTLVDLCSVGKIVANRPPVESTSVKQRPQPAH